MTVDPELTKKFFNQEDYRGAYHLVDTDMIGIYTPADQQHPAYSAPPPDYSYTFTKFLTSADLKFYNSYYYQCQNYMLLASDSRRLEYAMTAEELFFPAIQDIFDDGKGWVITPNQQILTMHILEAQPRIHNEEQKIFDWNVKFDIFPKQKSSGKTPGSYSPSPNSTRADSFATEQSTVPCARVSSIPDGIFTSSPKRRYNHGTPT